MISLAEARRIIAGSIFPRPAVRMPLAAAQGHILTEAVTADVCYPAGDLSRMDGYVVRADAEPGSFRLVGEIAAGAPADQALQPGECCRIFTGALLPPGGGRVLMQEEAERHGDMVLVANFGSSLFVRIEGSEAVPGQVVLQAGIRLGAAELAVLAQVGVTQPWVVPMPRVHHLATGGELVDPSEVPGPGCIRDTNSTLLRALLGVAGVTGFSTSRVADDAAHWATAAESGAELLVLSGGASAGDFDFGAQTLRKLGYTIHFDRVNLRPGKPLTFATRGNQAAFVVPGNPVSHFVCYHTAIALAVDTAAGRRQTWPAVWLELEDGPDLQADPRETWWPALAGVRDGFLTVRPLSWSSSGNSFSLAGCNALVLVNAGSPARGKVLTLLLGSPST